MVPKWKGTRKQFTLKKSYEVKHHIIKVQLYQSSGQDCTSATENSDTFAFLLALLFCCCFFARVALLLRQFVAFLLVVACLLTISYCFFALLLLCSELYIAFLRCCFVAVAFLLVLLFCSAKTYSATKQHKQKSNWASNGLLFCSCSQQLLRVAPCLEPFS